MCKAKLSHKDTGRPKVTVQCIRESLGSDSDSASSSSYTDEYAFTVDTDSGTLTVTVEDEPVDMLIDSGATRNIINGVLASKLKACGARVGRCCRVIHPLIHMVRNQLTSVVMSPLIFEWQEKNQ